MIIDQHKAYTYFNSNFVVKKSTNGWWIFDNPFDPDGEGKKKMAVHFKYQLVKCWRTEWRGSIVDFVMEYEGLNYFDAKNKINDCKATNVDLDTLSNLAYERVSDVQMPLGYTPILSGRGTMAERAKNYLLGRGFNLEVMDRLGIGYSAESGPTMEEDYFGYIIIPFKKRGQLKYYIGRDFCGNYLRYKNPPEQLFGVGKKDILFNEDATELYKVNFILEGWSDALTIGKEAIATLGWSMSDVQKSKIMQSHAKRLVFVPDVGFYKTAVKLAMEFMDEKEVMVVDIEPFCDVEKEEKDVNGIGLEKFNQAYANTQVMNEQMAMEILMS